MNRVNKTKEQQKISVSLNSAVLFKNQLSCNLFFRFCRISYFFIVIICICKCSFE